MGMSAHYYAYAQDVIEAIKNSGDGEALDEYDLDKMWDAMHKTLTSKNVFEAMSAGEIFTTPNPLLAGRYLDATRRARTGARRYLTRVWTT